MRFFAIAVVLIGMLAGPLTAPAQTAPARPGPEPTRATGLAPADEYFGQYGQSVLELRNRMAAIESASDADIATAGEITAIDRVENAVMAWQQKYPADPWVAKYMSRLVASYARAHAARSARAAAVFASLTTAYPKSSEADQAILAVWDAPAETTGREVVRGDVVAAATGAPVPGAVVMIAPNHESSDLASTPFATTGSDGSFAVENVPLAPAEYIVVEPPRASAYAVYHGKIDAAAGKGQAGIIRLAAR
ncbi:MAG: carboxypeptidase-like regulatory domain-containing protein [Candidatus Tumulicola sp.]